MFLDDCANNPCVNLGTCYDRVGYFQCECLPGFEGRTCQGVSDLDPPVRVNHINSRAYLLDDDDDCLSSPCQHGGTCNDVILGYTCTCAIGSCGENCEILSSDEIVDVTLKASECLQYPACRSSYIVRILHLKITLAYGKVPRYKYTWILQPA